MIQHLYHGHGKMVREALGPRRCQVSRSTSEAEGEGGVIPILSSEVGAGVEQGPQIKTVTKRERGDNFHRTEGLGKEVVGCLTEDGVIVETRLEVAQTCSELG